MEVNPLEGLRLVAVNHQLVCSSTAEAQRQQPRTAAAAAAAAAAAEDSAAQRGTRSSTRSSTRSGLGPRKWACGSRSSPGSSGPPRLQRTHHSPDVAARERGRVRNLRQAFHSLQAALPSVPPDTKLSKLDVLVLATNYIAHLTETLDHPGSGGGGPPPHHAALSRPGGYLRPVKKWPMRSLLYCGSFGQVLQGVPTNQRAHFGTQPLTNGEEAS